MTFYNAELPGFMSGGSEAAPVSLVDIVRGPSGREQRRNRRNAPLKRFNLGQSLRTLDDVYDMVAFFRVMNGPEHSFALRDIIDWKTCKPSLTPTNTDATIGTGDGATATFQLKKQDKAVKVDATTLAVDRNIILPVEGTVLIAVDGVAQTETTHYTVDYTTGVVTFTGGNIPAVGLVVTAGFEYNTKVRFDTNDLSAAVAQYLIGEVPSIPLIEVVGD